MYSNYKHSTPLSRPTAPNVLMPAYIPSTQSITKNPIDYQLYEYSQQSKLDEEWVNKWLKAKNKDLESKFTSTTNRMSISDCQMVLKKCLNDLNSIKDTEKYLKDNIDIIHNNEWTSKIFWLNEKKDLILKSLQWFKDDDIKSIRSNIKKRKYKRQRQNEKKKKTKLDLERRKNIDEAINQWLEEEKEKVLKIKRDEHLKQDADVVLSDVTKRKSEAKKNLSLIQSLKRLREVREKAAQGRGEKVSQQESKTFLNVIERLEKIWEKSLNVYLTEEQGLKLILEHNAQQDFIEKETKKVNDLILEWEYALFGRKLIPTDEYLQLTCADKDLYTFIAIRKSWDTFLSNDNSDPNSSSIPIGWVLPAPPSSEQWQKYLLSK